MVSNSDSRSLGHSVVEMASEMVSGRPEGVPSSSGPGYVVNVW
jgi:hypothetical protein